MFAGGSFDHEPGVKYVARRKPCKAERADFAQSADFRPRRLPHSCEWRYAQQKLGGWFTLDIRRC